MQRDGTGDRVRLIDPADVTDHASGVRLRRPHPADIPGLLAVHADPAVYQFDLEFVHPDARFTADWLASITRHWVEHGFGYWTVLVPADWAATPVAALAGAVSPVAALAGDDRRVIAGMGGIRWHHPKLGQPVLNVYYRFAVAAQGRGLARTVIGAAIDAARVWAPGRDLVVRTRPDNAPARHVAERAGFVDDGADPDDPTLSQLRRVAAAAPARAAQP